MEKFQLDFVGVGPTRAGTSWLHRNFVAHPQVLLPRDPVKETFFFDLYHQRGLPWYCKHFSNSSPKSGAILGEFGPSYFDVEAAPERIHAINPDCKIIVSVRDPIERAYSVYLHLIKLGRVPADFDAAIRQMPRIISSGHYKANVQRWVDYFGAERVFFVFLDRVKQHPLATLNQLCRFLGVDEFPEDNIIAEPVNAGYLPRFKWLLRLKYAVYSAARRHHQYRLLAAGRKLSKSMPGWMQARSSKDAYPRFTDDQRRWLSEYYEQDVAFVETLQQSVPMTGDWPPESLLSIAAANNAPSEKPWSSDPCQC